MTPASPPPVRWGFIGAGFVATQALAPAVHASPHAVLQAVAARDIGRADALEPAGFSSGDYRHVIAHDDVDAVYISLTNDVHLEWILAAIEGGKHVLCEKPLTLNGPDCRIAFAAARAADRLLVEAVWNQWHPRTRRLRELFSAGTLGDVRGVTAEFTFDGVPSGNYRLDQARGGGALLDVGPYLLRPVASWAGKSWTVDEAERLVSERATDLRTRAVLSSPSEAKARVLASFSDPEHQLLRIDTEGGSVTYGSPAFTSWRAASTLELADGQNKWSESFASCDAYELMVTDVSRRVQGDDESFVVSEEETSRCMHLMDLIDAKARRP